ncbi:hypothetical protein, partial [Amaricoccus sp.]|uniref:ImuA family protein n=1 Tax=Amaricoccus sp. TaxID=1872485 RepID=UPI00345B2E54
PDRPPVTLAPDIAFAPGRAHEITGPARRALALLIAARTAGPVLWLGPAWSPEQLMGDGIADLVEPGRIVLGAGRTATDLLWAAEEAARAGPVGLVVVELDHPPGLTPVRRLHLAAEAGGGALVLLLTPDDGGAAGVESRWRADPAPGWAVDGAPRWRIARLRSRVAPPAAWTLRLTAGGGAPVAARAD